VYWPYIYISLPLSNPNLYDKDKEIGTFQTHLQNEKQQKDKKCNDSDDGEKGKKW